MNESANRHINESANGGQDSSKAVSNLVVRAGAKMLGTVIITAALGYGLVLLLAFIFQERLLYFPLRSMAVTPAAAGLEFEEVWLTTGDGVRIFGWYVPAAGSRRALLFFHGNGGNISHRLDSIAQFQRLGLNVFIIDYRGYGHSEGRPTEAGTTLDAAAAWRYLVEQRGFAPEQIVIFGRSLGGAVAAGLAEQQRPGALILESTFTSVPDMAARQFPFLPVRQLSRLHYNTRERLARIDAPVLIIHSPNDEVIPFEHGRALFATAGQPKEFLQIDGGHNDGFLISAGVYEPAVAAFINRYLE